MADKRKRIAAVILAALIMIVNTVPAFAAGTFDEMSEAIQENFTDITFSSSILSNISKHTDPGTADGFAYEIGRNSDMKYGFDIDAPYIKASGVFGSGLEVGEKLSSIVMDNTNVYVFSCDCLKIGGKQYYFILPIVTSGGTKAADVKAAAADFVSTMEGSKTLETAKTCVEKLNKLTWTDGFFDSSISIFDKQLKGYLPGIIKKNGGGASETSFTHTGAYYDISDKLKYDTNLSKVKKTIPVVAFKCNYTKMASAQDPVWVICSYSNEYPSSSEEVREAFANLKAAYLDIYNLEDPKAAGGEDAKDPAGKKTAGTADEEIDGEVDGEVDEEIDADTDLSDAEVIDDDPGIVDTGTEEGILYDTSGFTKSMAVLDIEPLSYLGEAELKASSTNPGDAIIRDTLGSFYALILVISISGMVISFMTGCLLICFGSVQTRHGVAMVLLKKIVVFFCIVSFASLLSNFLRIVGSFL